MCLILFNRQPSLDKIKAGNWWGELVDNHQKSIDPRIIEKIKKCLALSRSTNPHEAATALRQAHALMEKHGVSSNEITMSDIGESVLMSKTMARKDPSRWESYLVSTIGKAFGCQLMFLRHPDGRANTGAFVFVGLKHNAEIASYVASVTVRRCKKARQEWLKKNMEGYSSLPGGRSKMTRLGDTFAEGWCASASKAIHDFANPPEIEQVLTDYIEQKTKDGKTTEPRIPKEDRLAHIAAAAGFEAGKGVSLHHAMSAADRPLTLEQTR